MGIAPPLWPIQLDFSLAAMLMQRFVCVAGMLLVDVEMANMLRPATLQVFIAAQEAHLGEVSDALHTDWVLKVMGIIEDIKSPDLPLVNFAAPGGTEVVVDDERDATPPTNIGLRVSDCLVSISLLGIVIHSSEGKLYNTRSATKEA